jgi:iron complex outermembrane receptor protein
MSRIVALSRAAAAALPVLLAAAPVQAAEDEMVEEVVVSATRVSLPANALPTTIRLIDAEAIALQSQLHGSAVDVVSTLVPSFSPTREKLSGQGESLRGRRPLYLIDGVPQSNPLRDGSREGYTIDPFFVERVEVIFGSNAIQGIGATGGVVNYATVAPATDADRWRGRLMAQFGADGGFRADSGSSRLGALAGRDFGRLDVTAGIAWQSRGAFYDGDGRRIGVDGTQGEVQDSDSLSLFLKAGVELGASRRLELMAQQFELEGDGDYVVVPGSRTAGRPASAIRGASPGVLPTNTVRTASLTYTDTALLGGRLTAQAFLQDFESVFGGGTFADFQDPRIQPGGGLFDQSSNNSDKLGLRLAYERPIAAVAGLRSHFGIDLLRDTTFQALVATRRNWVPETTFDSVAPFAQLFQSLFDERLTLAAGLRHEFARLDVDDYETLWFYGPRAVAGGSPDFDESLANFGATWRIAGPLSVYASYAEGYTMPDVGRILRAVTAPGQDVDDFLDLQPVVADNVELGIEWRGAALSAGAAYFWSDSDRGALLVLRGGDVFEVQRQRTEIEGLELSASWRTPLPGLTLSSAYAALEGRTDGNGDGRVDQDLDGANISPDRLNVALEYSRGPLLARLQAQSFLSRRFAGTPGAGRFEGYEVADAMLRWSAPAGAFTLTVANLLDESYVTYHSQTVRPTDNLRYFAGRGRSVSLGFEKRF